MHTPNQSIIWSIYYSSNQSTSQKQPKNQSCNSYNLLKRIVRKKCWILKRNTLPSWVRNFSIEAKPVEGWQLRCGSLQNTSTGCSSLDSSNKFNKRSSGVAKSTIKETHKPHFPCGVESWFYKQPLYAHITPPWTLAFTAGVAGAVLANEEES